MENEKHRHIYFECNDKERTIINNIRLEFHDKGITFDSASALQRAGRLIYRPKSRWWFVNYVRWLRQQIRNRRIIKYGPNDKDIAEAVFTVEWHTDWSLSGATVDDIIAELNEREIPHTVVEVTAG